MRFKFVITLLTMFITIAICQADDVKFKNKIKKLSSSEMERTEDATTGDLRPILQRMIIKKGMNHIYTDRESGYNYSIEYDGKSAEYIVTDAGGKKLDTTLIQGFVLDSSGKKETEGTWKLCYDAGGGSTGYKVIECYDLTYEEKKD